MNIHACLLVITFCLPGCLFGQNKDSVKLSCPLKEAVESVTEQKATSLGAETPKVVFTSLADTTVKACMKGTVTNIMRNGDGRWEIMFNNEAYYCYYSGIGRIKVVKGQKLEAGDAIGTIKPGDKIELMIYDFETPLDPKGLLDCWKGSGQ